MDLFFLLGELVLCALALFYGPKIGKKEKKVYLPCLLVSLGLLIFIQWIRMRDDLVWNFLPWEGFTYFEFSAFVPFAVFFFSVAKVHLDSKLLSKILLPVLSYFLILYMLLYSSWIFRPTIVCPRPTQINDGVCLQSTGSTCGPACLVTLLAQENILCEEQKMVEMTHTLEGLGTTVLRMAWALQKIVPENRYRVRVEKLDFLKLQKLKRPSIVTVTYSTMVNHFIVVLEVREDDLVVGDPLGIGKRKWSKEVFLRKWRGSTIFLEPID